MFDRVRALGLLDGAPGSVVDRDHRVRREVWRYLVAAADERGRVEVTAGGIAVALAGGLSASGRPMSKKRMQNQLAWLRKSGLLVTVAAGGDPSTGRGNTFQLADKRSAAPEAQAAIEEADRWLAEDVAEGDALALWVAGIWDVRDCGPTLAEAAQRLRPELPTLPRAAQRHYLTTLIREMTGQGWVRVTGPQRVLKPGPRTDHNTRRDRANARTTRVAGHPLLADRGY